MTKQEIVDKLKSARMWNSVDCGDKDVNRLWQQAFDLYNAETGNKMRAKDCCNKCYERVKEWLVKL